jgi:hypothetical protein
MIFNNQNPYCHPERSEGSRRPANQILRCAQDDKLDRPPGPLADLVGYKSLSAVGAINWPLRMGL